MPYNIKKYHKNSANNAKIYLMLPEFILNNMFLYGLLDTADEDSDFICDFSF